MKITPKLLIGKYIKESNKISEAEKITMLAEIMYLSEEELDAWIDLTLLDESGVLDSLFESLVEGKQSGFVKGAKKFSTEAPWKRYIACFSSPTINTFGVSKKSAINFIIKF